jgi:hypothetical protein
MVCAALSVSSPHVGTPLCGLTCTYSPEGEKVRWSVGYGKRAIDLNFHWGYP